MVLCGNTIKSVLTHFHHNFQDLTDKEVRLPQAQFLDNKERDDE